MTPVDDAIVDSTVEQCTPVVAANSTDEMRCRYRQLFPSAEFAAIKVVCA